MKVIIAGSRALVNYADVEQAVLQSGYVITEVVSGRAPGVDRLGERWARENGVALKTFPAMWRTKDGERDISAGIKRNLRMAEYADALVSVWDGSSHGTRHMIEAMRRIGKPVFVYHPDEL